MISVQAGDARRLHFSYNFQTSPQFSLEAWLSNMSALHSDPEKPDPIGPWEELEQLLEDLGVLATVREEYIGQLSPQRGPVK